MRLFILSILICMISCNIKQPKNYSNEIVSPSNTQKNQKTVVKDQIDISDEQFKREKIWIDSSNVDLKIEIRTEAIVEYADSISKQYRIYMSEHTKSIIRNEVFSKLEYFNENIKKIQNVQINKNHINTKKGIIKDLYIEFAKSIAKNYDLVKSLVDHNNIESHNNQLTLNFIKHIMEIKISNALIENNRPIKLDELADEQLYEALDNLEAANTLRLILIDKNFSFKVERNLRNKLNILKFNDDKLYDNQVLLQIKFYVDLFLE